MSRDLIKIRGPLFSLIHSHTLNTYPGRTDVLGRFMQHSKGFNRPGVI